MKAIVRKFDGKVMWINGTKYGYMLPDPETCEIIEVPEQDVSAFFDGEGETLPLTWPADIVQYSLPEREALVDVGTERGIGRELHPFSPMGEQFGALRDQVVQILNALGLEPTADFARFNEVAVAEIEKGQAKKAVL